LIALLELLPSASIAGVGQSMDKAILGIGPGSQVIRSLSKKVQIASIRHSFASCNIKICRWDGIPCTKFLLSDRWGKSQRQGTAASRWGKVE
jgi:hypothetical protein